MSFEFCIFKGQPKIKIRCFLTMPLVTFILVLEQGKN